ncbi:MAG: glycosyltransferase [Planctomycetota bacterium]
MLRLASGLKRSGLHAEVVTPSYAASWPTDFVISGLRVRRPITFPRREWSMGRYARQLTTWLKEHVAGFDCVFIDELSDESSAVLAVRNELGVPVIVRHGGDPVDGADGQIAQPRSKSRALSMARLADRVITPTAWGHRQLLSRQCREDQIVRIEVGFPAEPMGRSDDRRRAARKSLAAVNTDLRTDHDGPVVLTVGRMVRDGGMSRLAESVFPLVNRYPNLRFWLIGDGPARDTLYTNLKADGLRGAFAMPGSFNDFDELFVAADIYVQADGAGLSGFLPLAVASELPLVVADREANRSVLRNHPAAGWYKATSASELRGKIRNRIESPNQSRSDAVTLRKYLVREASEQEMILKVRHCIESAVCHYQADRSHPSALVRRGHDNRSVEPDRRSEVS